MSFGIRPLSIAMPLAALLIIAVISLISAISNMWSMMSPELHSTAVLFIICFASIAASILFFLQSRGIASLLPYKFQDCLVNWSLVDGAQSLWRSTGDIVDAALLIGLRMDRDHTERALSRLPPTVRKTLSQPGIINFLPSPLSNLVLPEHVRRKLQRPRVAFQDRVEEEPREQFLMPIIVEVSERRILSLSRALLNSFLSRNPLLRLSQKHYRALMFVFSCISFIHLVRSRSYRRMSFNAFKILVFISAMSVNILNLKRSRTPNLLFDGRAASSQLARSSASRHALDLSSRKSTHRSIPYRRLIIAGTSAVAVGAIYMRYRKNKRLR